MGREGGREGGREVETTTEPSAVVREPSFSVRDASPLGLIILLGEGPNPWCGCLSSSHSNNLRERLSFLRPLVTHWRFVSSVLASALSAYTMEPYELSQEGDTGRRRARLWPRGCARP